MRVAVGTVLVVDDDMLTAMQYWGRRKALAMVVMRAEKLLTAANGRKERTWAKTMMLTMMCLVMGMTAVIVLTVLKDACCQVTTAMAKSR